MATAVSAESARAAERTGWLLVAILLVFTVLLIEFRSFYEPIAIVFGAVLALFGTVIALWVTGVSLNIIAYLGAIIGVGIVAKNGILVLDYFRQLRERDVEVVEALVQAGHRRLRPVLMTSLAAVARRSLTKARSILILLRGKLRR